MNNNNNKLHNTQATREYLLISSISHNSVWWVCCGTAPVGAGESRAQPYLPVAEEEAEVL